MKDNENILGTEKIISLIRKFSIPCIISMLVNSLYNIVDQIFIGRGVGMLGNGATNVVFPISMVALAISLMIGDGASAYLSLKLGEKKSEEASQGVGNGFTLTVILSIFLTIVCLVFLNPLLNLFGCTDNLREYAVSYGRIIVFGLPFVMIGTALNSMIRSDGSPKYSMASMVIGAVLNIILDPIFIFKFHMGVEGAALATVISQFVTFLLNILYIRKFQSICLHKQSFVLQRTVSKSVLMLGISSFITQMSFVVVISIENNLLGKYGLDTKYGSEIPITVLGIVMKISQILNSIVIGLAVGCQPIFGYNYGARKMERVKSTLKYVLGISVVITVISFLLFQTIPDVLIRLFGSGDANYMEFAEYTFRIYLMLVICVGIQIPSGIFFQAIGKSSKSAILSLSRQIVFLIPAMFILGHFFGLMGVLYAGPVADGLSFLLAILFLTLEMRKMSLSSASFEKKQEVHFVDHSVIDRNVVVTVAREYGSGGRYVGKLLAERLQIPLYDKDFILKVSEETGLSADYIKENEQKKSSFDMIHSGYYSGLNNADELFLKESEVIQNIAKKGSCVIVGRAADFVLREQENVISIFLYSDMKHKVNRAVKYYGIKEDRAEKEIKKINKLRANHYKYYTSQEWNDPENYDLCINTDVLGVEETASLIANFIEKKY